MKKTTAAVIQRINQEADEIDEVSKEIKDVFFSSRQLLIKVMQFLPLSDVHSLLCMVFAYAVSKQNKQPLLKWDAEKKAKFLFDKSNTYKQSDIIQAKINKQHYYFVDRLFRKDNFATFYKKLKPINFNEQISTYFLKKNETWESALNQRIKLEDMQFNDPMANQVFEFLLKRNEIAIKEILTASPSDFIRGLMAELINEAHDPSLLFMYVHHYASQSLLDSIYLLLKDSKLMLEHPLHVATLCKQPLSVIVDLKPSKNEIYEYYKGIAPIFIAALGGRCDLMTYIFAQDEDAYKLLEQSTGDTILHIAARYGHVELASLILKHLKENKQLSDDAIKKYILTFNRTTPNRTAWQCALRLSTTGEMSALLSPYITNFIGYDEPPQGWNKEATTPVNLAVKQGHPDTLSMLLDKPGVLALYDKYGLLVYAVDNNRVKNAHVLMQYGANPNKMIFNSVLILAIEERNVDMVATLLEDGANADLIEFNGNPAAYLDQLFPKEKDSLTKERILNLLNKYSKVCDSSLVTGIMRPAR